MGQQYVCGFLFSDDFTRVALIAKAKPAWQVGKLNGIGGKIDLLAYDNTTYENPIYERVDDAMAREFREETGYSSSPEHWTHYLTETFANGAVVHFLWAHCATMPVLRTMEEEQVVVHRVQDCLQDALRGQLMYNLPYLIEMAIALANLPPEHRPLP